MTTLLLLFWEFLKIGMFSLGGAMAAIPFLYDMSDRMGWFSYAQIADMIAVSESTPGPLGINMATYVGFTVGGIPGAVLATLGIALPGIILVCIVSRVLSKFRENKRVQAALYGLRPTSMGLISAAGLTVVGVALLDMERYAATGYWLDIFSWPALVLAAVLLVLTNFVGFTKKLHPVVFIAASAAVGIIFKF